MTDPRIRGLPKWARDHVNHLEQHIETLTSLVNKLTDRQNLTSRRRCVYLASPLRGDYARNVMYGRRALRDSLMRGEAVTAPHILYAQEGVLDDTDAAEREIGVSAGKEWIWRVDALAAYCDYGISEGMQSEIDLAEALGIPVERRRILSRV